MFGKAYKLKSNNTLKNSEKYVILLCVLSENQLCFCISIFSVHFFQKTFGTAYFKWIPSCYRWEGERISTCEVKHKLYEIDSTLRRDSGCVCGGQRADGDRGRRGARAHRLRPVESARPPTHTHYTFTSPSQGIHLLLYNFYL